jgi:hypothetical protein
MGTPFVASYIFDYNPNITINYFKDSTYQAVIFDRTTKVGEELFTLCKLKGLSNELSPNDGTIYDGEPLKIPDCIVCQIQNNKTTIILLQFSPQSSFQELTSLMDSEKELNSILNNHNESSKILSSSLSRLIVRKDEGDVLICKSYRNEDEEFECLILQHVNIENRFLPEIVIPNANPLPKIDLDLLYTKTENKEHQQLQSQIFQPQSQIFQPQSQIFQPQQQQASPFVLTFLSSTNFQPLFNSLSR